MPKKDSNDIAARANRVKKRLLNAAGKNPETLLIQYDNTLDGFDEEKIDDMRDEYGSNAISRRKKAGVFTRLLEAFVNPFTVVLFVLAAISFFTGDFAAVAIVLVMVSVSGALRFVQEHRSGKAADRLIEMVETTISVQRVYTDEDTEEETSRRAEIPLGELVVGDVVYLAAGDMIPADVRIIKAKDLFVSQSSLTGESEPVEKFADKIQGKRHNPLDLNNLAFMGCNVISGSAVALALAVGDDTVLGAISRQMQEKKPPTSFEKGVNSVSWVLIRFMLIMVPVVLLLNGFTKGDWLQAVLFAVSIAVGLTPEMLPMIVSANLAKGAVSMAKKQVVVKDMNSIQNFGAMDVLCTDKTGTITQDRVILQYHLDIHGNDDIRVLRHAFLNSYFQTGLKNLMDISIIEKSQEQESYEQWQKFTKLDEIPFDFHRRRMSVVVADEGGKTQLITKGAIEEMLSISSYVEYKGKVEPLTEDIREEVLQTCKQYNADGMRVLGLSQKTNPAPAGAFSVADESDMVLLGYLAFLDPPKDSAEEAIAALSEYGVTVKVLTGDNDAVTKSVCKQVGIPVEHIVLGSDVEKMAPAELKAAVEETNVFAKLSPDQKARIVTALRENGHVVGYMGDGINDAAAMRASDVGISVDTAVDIAKESANLILMEKDLMVLEEGVVEGRKIYANIIKYIKMTASSNFGNMFSVLAASAFLPFLPMLPIQILILNLIYDISCITVPWDNVDTDYLQKPRKWDASSITKFMLWIGPTSSLFDVATYVLLFAFICPAFAGGAYTKGNIAFEALFQSGWFVESLWSQTLVIHMIRTPKIPFIQSRASWQVTLLTTCGIAVGTALPFASLLLSGDIEHGLKMAALPWVFFPALMVIIFGYMLLTTLMKKLFVKRYGELL
ncbi:MAG: magnesium-translocating P-type ATPase [Oscillospiraceae bacterium]|jgi:Mg2+-importing ATPase|nr:magnesium-translocating P-type ATPase [Oscillospiraceae bacterium]